MLPATPMSTAASSAAVPARVLFVCGWGRSGSTIIGSILGESNGLFNAGELRAFPEYWGSGEGRCGCGKPHRDCEFWKDVWNAVVEASAGAPPVMSAMAAAQRTLVRTDPWHLWRIRQALQRRREDGPLAQYSLLLMNLHSAIRSVTGAHTIIDTSKSPAHAYLAARLGIQVHVLHLVRNPTAVAYSWQRRKLPGIDFGPARSSVRWLTHNLATEALHGRHPHIPYLLLRYEDFVRSPAEEVQRILGFLGERSLSPAFISPTTVRLSTNHTVAGNSPARFRSGLVELSSDDEWRSRMSPASRVIAAVPALPLLRRYGYCGDD